MFLPQKLTKEILSRFIAAATRECLRLLEDVRVLCYVHPDKFGDMPTGAYLLNPKTLQLEAAPFSMTITPDDHAPHNARMCKDAHFSLFFFAPIESSSQSFGPKLIHTGRLCQRLMVEATFHSIGLCPIGGMNYVPLHAALTPKFGEVKFLHSMLGGYQSEAPQPEPAKATPDLPSTMRFLPNDGTMTNRVKDYLGTKIPPYMVPAFFILVTSLPITSNGKLDRTQISEIAKTKYYEAIANQTPKEEKHIPASPRGSIEETPATAADGPTVARITRRDAEKELFTLLRAVLPRTEKTQKMGLDDNFFSLGATSLTIVQLYGKLQMVYPIFGNVSVTTLFDYPSINMMLKLMENLLGYSLVVPVQKRKIEIPTALSFKNEVPSRDIAVIGYSCRFPSAATIDKYWELLRNGVEPVTFFSKEQLLQAGFSEATVNNPKFVAASAVLSHPTYFDAEFFGISGKEAALMDPQHRVFMLCAWEALERAGYLSSDAQKKNVGVWASASFNTYFTNNLLPQGDLMSSPSDFMKYLVTNDKDYVASRVAYHLNLTGPAVVVQSACSSSLLAVTQACNALNNGDCSAAIAGGASIVFPEVSGYVHEEGNIFSKDGHCRVFDSEASGIIRGNGAGVVVLKRLEDAKRDRDNIHCVIKGWGTNNDGFDKAGFTAPSASSQANVMVEALRRANAEPESVGYIEAHGTATRVGDNIEAQSLKQVFSSSPSSSSSSSSSTTTKSSIAVGSVKSNIGHLDVACGIAGLLKAILSIEHKQIPPSLHFRKPNPEASFDPNGPLFVNTQLKNWETPLKGGKRRAAINSFGIGGTNVAMVVEEYIDSNYRKPVESKAETQILVVSAKTNVALQDACTNLSHFLQTEALPNLYMTDLAYTLQHGRKEFPYRATVIAKTIKDASENLGKLASHISHSWPKTPTRAPPVVLLFPGQNTEFFGMARVFYQTFQKFHSDLDNCLAILTKMESPINIKDRVTRVLLAEPGEFTSDEKIPTNVVQPSLFIFQYCCARLVMRLGVNPSAMIGHSLGEYTAACLSGVLTLEDAIHIVCTRGEILHSLRGSGAMLVAQVDEREAIALVRSNNVCVAAVNSPQQTVLSGPRDALEKIQKLLSDKGKKTRMMGEYPFHHSKLDTKRLAEVLRGGQISLNKPSMPYLSNLTGTWITPEQATNPQYWADHMTHCVRFMDSVNEAQLKMVGLEGEDTPPPVWIEIGPGAVLSSIIGHILPHSTTITCLPHLEHNSSYEWLLEAIGVMWSKGLPIDWQTLGEERVEKGKEKGDNIEIKPRTVELPTYPFQYKDFKVVPKTVSVQEKNHETQNDGAKPSIANRDADTVMQTISTLWVDVIGHTGAHGESWFEVGGDSLNCVQLVGRFNSAFGVSISVQSIFAHPTVASQCELLQECGLYIAEAPKGDNHQVTVKEYSASLQQESLYFIELLHPKGPEYLVHFAAEIHGNLVLEDFQASFAAVMAKHAETLMCHFAMKDDTLTVHTSDTPFQLYAYYDWADLPDKELTIKKYIKEEAVRGFDVHSPTELLLRVHLIRASPASHVLFVVAHHLILDGWSLGVLTEDLTKAYHNISNRSPSAPLSPLPAGQSYSHFVRWQRERMSKSNPIREKLAKYWRTQLKDIKPLVFGDYPRPATPSTKGARVPVTLPSDLIAGLTQAAHKCKTTLFAVLMAAFQLLLHFYSAQSDIAVATACANRLRSEWENIVGLFTNMVVIRTPNMESLPTLSAVLAHISSTTLQALEHQEMPFHIVVEEVNPPRDPSIHPLFQVAFILHTEQSTKAQSLLHSDSDSPKLFVAPRSTWETDTQTTRFDFNLQLWPHKESGGLAGYIEYATNLFREDTVQRMVANFSSLCSSIVSNHTQEISTLSFLSPEETNKVTVAFNATGSTFPNVCVHQMIEERAQQHPRSTALVWEADGHTWTYETLNRAANSVAKYLVSYRIKRNERVGLIFERSPLAIITMLATWKAGAAYVPINPDSTKSQFLHILEDAKVNTVIVHGLTDSTVRTLVADTSVTVLNVESFIGREFTAADDVSPITSVSTSDLAYIIYTSGSTGKPKGVCIEHRGLTNLIHDLANISWKLSTSDRMLQSGKYFFDFSVSEIFVPLYCGASLVLAQQVKLLPGPEFVALLQKLDISVLKILPSALNTLRDYVLRQHDILPHLRLIITAGEALPYNTITTWVSSTRALINSYGPTEITVCSNTWRVEKSDLLPDSSHGIVPVGSPISNTKSFILQPRTLQILPIGAVGELFIAGTGVARGYTNTKLMHQKFLTLRELPKRTADDLAAVLTKSENSRLYRTGDLARWLPDGKVQILGRTDSQVKLQGYRIELEEIRSVLCSHSAVTNAAVVLHSPIPDDPSANQLVAFVECGKGEHNNHDDLTLALRSHVASILPIYMHPYMFVIGPLPRGASGKVDLKALKVPSILSSLAQNVSSSTHPANRIESELLREFCSVLHLEGREKDIGVNASFFELGGNSLLAARLLTRLHSQFNQILPLTTLFSHHTVRQLAGVLRQSPPTPSTTPLKSPLVMIQEGETTKSPLFCIHPAGGNAMCFYPLASELPEYPIYALEDPNSGEEPYSFSSINDMAEAYISAIKTVQPKGPYYLIGFSLGGVVANSIASLLDQRGDYVALVLAIDSRIRGKDTDNHIEDRKIIELLIDRLERAVKQETENGTLNNSHSNGTSSANHGRNGVQAPLTDEEQWEKVNLLLTQLFHRQSTPSSFSSPTSSPFASRFTFLFRKHLHLLTTHTPQTTHNNNINTVVMLCNAEKQIKQEIEREWSEACGTEVEFIHLPSRSFSHNTVMYQPCIKYVANVLRARLELVL